MNIQLSVIVWTVICFSLLMLILRNWLFRPVLKVLDQRRNRLDAAREKKAAYERMEAEHRQLQEVRRAEHMQKQKEELLSAVEEIQANEKIQVKRAHKECLERIDAYRKQTEKTQEDLLAAVNPQLQQVAEVFAQQIISHRI